MSFGYLKQRYVSSTSVMLLSVVIGLTTLPAMAQGARQADQERALSVDNSQLLKQDTLH